MGAVFEAIAHERVVERVKEGKATNQSAATRDREIDR